MILLGLFLKITYPLRCRQLGVDVGSQGEPPDFKSGGTPWDPRSSFWRESGLGEEVGRQDWDVALQ